MYRLGMHVEKVLQVLVSILTLRYFMNRLQLVCMNNVDKFGVFEALYRKTGEKPSYERVQCLLLFGIYLQSTSSVCKCWMTVGQAIRMAQSLGIHVDDPLRSARYREYKRRIWHGCVWLDR